MTENNIKKTENNHAIYGKQYEVEFLRIAIDGPDQVIGRAVAVFRKDGTFSLAPWEDIHILASIESYQIRPVDNGKTLYWPEHCGPNTETKNEE